MDMKWAIGAAVAVLAATLALPGIVGADPGDRDEPIPVTENMDKEAFISGEADCRDSSGNFTAHFVLQIDAHPGAQFIGLDDPTTVLPNGQDVGVDLVGNPGTVDWDTNLFIENGNYVDEDGDPITGNGTYQDSHQFGSADVNDIIARTSVVWWSNLAGPNYYAREISTTVENPGYCVATACVDGNVVSFPVNAPESDTDDCDLVQLCYDGENMTVTQHDLNNNPNLQDAEQRACIPQEDPEPEPEEPKEPVEEVEEVQDVVAEVAPAVDEVAALPAAGQGVAGVTYTWIALLGLAVIGFGGATTLMARARK